MIHLNWLYPPKPNNAAEEWHWPAAVYPGHFAKQAAFVISQSPYSDVNAKTGNHLPLAVVILNHNSGKPINPARCLFEERFRRLDEAIQFVHKFLTENSHWHPLVH